MTNTLWSDRRAGQPKGRCRFNLRQGVSGYTTEACKDEIEPCRVNFPARFNRVRKNSFPLPFYRHPRAGGGPC
ncbi:hypothetical protein MTBSS4_110056 [Magnetospirillum sp. SS-4]|nr:hypothetical protein MTBSS4_110056 [Magnetospirillum sp. SS-4]